MQSNNYLATICWQMHKFCHKSFPDHFNTIWNSFYIKFLGDTRRLKFMIKPFVQVACCIYELYPDYIMQRQCTITHWKRLGLVWRGPNGR